MKTRRVASACLLAVALIPAEVLGDPITVTSGFLSVTGLSTNAMFEIDGQDFLAAGRLERGVVFPDLTCFPCEAGDPISLRTSLLSSAGAGTATVDGTVFPLIGFSAVDFLFVAPGIVAPSTPGSFTVVRPFTFSGSLSGFQVSDPNQTPIFQRLLVGQGLTTASFSGNPNPDGPALFTFRSIRYDFTQPAPVPEPATFLLVGTGLGAALGLRRRARRAS